jgi:hypothetical protein
MKKLLILTAALTITFAVAAQTIKPEDAPKYVGKTGTVCGKIYGGKYLEKSKGKPTMLNMGAPYPTQPITIVVWDDPRSKLHYKPEEKWLNKQVCIFGKIISFKGKIEISVNDIAQIKSQ